ncbi:DUF2189 domain-containing protein [Breoghania sp. L-A4]|uniref:DUF2189 domain-containing protein n=1 Tax=Breoghania sp. L-A4 TaxID=2304600 RepID=UPI000E35C507|nr:DUF2189 domain-containing protein [Breoghania sp. L-A4]AXS40524.1 DUF2189 domain-containing protein [Breoghania sp. L-A4]
MVSATQESSREGQAKPVQGRTPPIVINTITTADIGAALSAGFRDFTAAPVYGLFFGGFYAVAGWLILGVLFFLDLHFMAYPLAAGFALVAPFVASGVYEVSRRQERGLPLSWSAVFGAIGASGRRDLGWMAVVTTFTLVIWIEIATVIYLVFFGLRPLDWGSLMTAVTSTANGLIFLGLGNLAGALLGITVFAISVVSFPLLLDRDIDFVTAMITSVRSVIENPRPMLFWAVLIAAGLALSLLSLFVGLFIVLPVLGHASWHVYRKLIPAEEAKSAEPTA